jgi:hypothetical protein
MYNFLLNVTAMGKQSDTEIYVHALRDVIFGICMLSLYFILQFPFWFLFAAHAATLLGLFFVYSSTSKDVMLPTLAAAIVLSIAAVDAYALLNTICLWNRCCLHGFDTTPWSFGVKMCGLTDVYSVPSLVFLAAATVAIGFIAGVQRAWALWGARPLMRFDVALFVLYCGIKIWLMQWSFIVRSFIASAVLVGTMGLDLAALLFVRRTKSLAILLFGLALGLDVLVVLTRTHLVHGLSGPSVGHPTTNQAAGRHLLQQDGTAAYSAVMDTSISSTVKLETAVQRRLNAAFETVRHEWSVGFGTYKSSLMAAESSLAATWNNPAFEAPLNASVTSLALYTTSMTLTQAEALWTDVLLEFGSFQTQLQTSSYIFEGAVVQTTARFDVTAENTVADAGTLGATAVGGGSAGASFAAQCAAAGVAVQSALAASQAALQTAAGTQNAIVMATGAQNQLLLAYGPPASNVRYDLTFAAALSSMRAFQQSYRIAVVNSVNTVAVAVAVAIADIDAVGVRLGAVFVNTASANTPEEYTSYWVRFRNTFWYPILRLVFGKDMRRNVAVTSSWDVHGKVVPVPVIVDAVATSAYSFAGVVVVAQILFAAIQKTPKKVVKVDEKHSVFFGAKGVEEGDEGDAVVVMHGGDGGGGTQHAVRRKTAMPNRP